MRITLLINTCLWFVFSLQAAEPMPSLKDPKEIVGLQIQTLDRLSERTQLTLAQIAHLRQAVAEYQVIQERYLENTEDHALLQSMLTSAEELLSSIKLMHMTAVFDVEFISELSTLSQLSKKMGLPKVAAPQS